MPGYDSAKGLVAVRSLTKPYTYTLIPNKYIRYETYQATPNQRIDLDSYVAESGSLIRTVLDHTRTKVEFETPVITDNSFYTHLLSVIQAGMTNGATDKERKVYLRYYDSEQHGYSSGWFYSPDITYTIRNVDEDNDTINYDQIRLAFIEY